MLWACAVLPTWQASCRHAFTQAELAMTRTGGALAGAAWRDAQAEQGCALGISERCALHLLSGEISVAIAVSARRSGGITLRSAVRYAMGTCVVLVTAVGQAQYRAKHSTRGSL